MTVTFFGHRDAPQNLYHYLKEVLTEMIEKENANTFYVGTHGNFDQLVCASLRELKNQYPHIRCSVVLAYVPQASSVESCGLDTVLPEVVVESCPKYSLEKRNRWMLQKSDTVITYVTRSYGGAAKFKALAQKAGKRTVELSAFHGASERCTK